LNERHPERFFDDWRVGDTFVTGECTVTREECLDFARRYDPQAFHLDDAAAQASMFGRLVASGWLTAALAMRLIVDSGAMRATGILGTGIDELRWTAPVYPGDALHVEGEVIELTPNPDGKRFGRMRIRCAALNQRGERVLTQIANLTARMR